MTRASSTLLLFLAHAFPAVVWRAWLLGGESVHLMGPDVLGLAGDMGVVLVLTSLAAGLLLVWAPLAVVVAMVHALMWWANYEQIVALDGSLLLGYVEHVADPTFIAGSVMTLSQPWLGLSMPVVAAVLIVLASRQPDAANGWFPLALGVPLLSYAAVTAPTHEAPLWRQENFLVANVESAVRKGPLEVPAAPFNTDLSGSKEWTLKERPNVLLVVLEGYAGAYIGPIATAHGQPDPVATPVLDGLSRSSLTFTQFLANQRQTNRGLYALLCGDYPYLGNGPVHMDAVAMAGHRRCLPSELAAAGYQTIFAQAAPLRFQSIGPFAKAVGFEQTVGGDWFKKARARNEWGVDDLSFFEQSLPLIDEAQAQAAPWFATLVTSGTHHPFNTVPESFPAVEGETDMDRAIRFADHAVGELLNSLEAKGVLEETVVLVTSDESLGLPDSADGPMRWLAANWSFLMVRHPDLSTRIDHRVAMHGDLALSIADLLGLANESLPWGGRSLFRTYAARRDIAFANTYTRSVYGLHLDGSAWRCKETFDRCVRWQPTDELLFAPAAGQEEPLPPADAQWLQAIAAYSRQPR